MHRLISALEERGFIRRLPNRARALEVLRQPDSSVLRPATRAPANSNPANNNQTGNVVQAAMRAQPSRPEPANDVIVIPLHGRIAAGMPIEALEGSTMLPVPAALLGAGEHYALEVSGDSMIEAGILDGDYALIRRTDVARDGEIVVALVRGEEATLTTCAARMAWCGLTRPMRCTNRSSIGPAKSRFRASWRGCCAGIIDGYH